MKKKRDIRYEILPLTPKKFRHTTWNLSKLPLIPIPPTGSDNIPTPVQFTCSNFDSLLAICPDDAGK